MNKTTKINGKALSYRELPGDSGGLNILYVHGATDHSWIWDHQMQAVATEHRRVAVDLPGRMGSDGPAIDNAADFRTFIANVAAHLELGQFVLCGHSMGGSIALDFALNHPDRLLGFAMVGSSPSWEMDAAYGPLLRSDPEAGLRKTGEEFGDVFSVHTAQSVRDEMQRQAQLVPTSSGARDILACMTYALEPQLGKVSVPAIVICGDEDPGSLPGSKRCAKEIPGAKFLLVERCGHSIMIEQPEVLNEALRGFVESLVT